LRWAIQRNFRDHFATLMNACSSDRAPVILGTTTTGTAQMIDHISVAVRDLERAARFYEAALAPLGLVRLVTRPGTIGFGKTYSEFWINLRASMSDVDADSGVHIALRAKSTGDVDAFHAAALAAGGRSDGPPGIRPHDRVKYYAAFVVDPDGNRIEAVTFPQ
jgi:catechol 2,3-dioxygenase-like lactoylglutathione lyase family enzyme